VVSVPVQEPLDSNVLACPHRHGTPDRAGAAPEWRCRACPRSFPVRDGIVHLIDSQLTFFDDKAQALAEMARVAKPGHAQ
jgi:uncharacterized protein YbaR (Trm112 family)